MEQTRVSVRQRPFQKRFGQPKRTGPYSRAAMIAAARAPLRAIAAPGEFKSVDVNGQINSDLTGELVFSTASLPVLVWIRGLEGRLL